MNYLYEGRGAVQYCTPVFPIAPATPPAEIESAIDEILRQRRRVPVDLLSEICNYRAVDADVDTEAAYERLAQLVNLAPGPVVFKIASKGNSYGLVAERDYSALGELVSGYGGVVTLDNGADNDDNHYAITYKTGRLMDGRVGFALQEKGRWVNEPNLEPLQLEKLATISLWDVKKRNEIIDTLQGRCNANVTRRNLKNATGSLLEFITYKPGDGKKIIRKGQEFLWYRRFSSFFV